MPYLFDHVVTLHWNHKEIFITVAKNLLLISKVFSQTIISALDECEKQGKFCPRLSTCEKNGTYDCVCIKGLRMVNKGQDRICEGTQVFTIFALYIFTLFVTLLSSNYGENKV